MSSFENGYAVVVGVAGYHSPGLPPLPLAILNDAVDVARALWDPDLCGYRADRVRLLLDEQATAEAVRKGLEWLIDRCGQDDTAVFFFSGHGWSEDGRSSLAAYDAQTGSLRGMIAGEELARYFKALRAGRLAIFLDSCFSGGLSHITGDGIAPAGYISGLDEGTYGKLCAGNGRVLLASSGPEQKSIVPDRERNSLFTSCLLRGLREAENHESGGLGIFDLFRFVAREVNAQSGGTQTPLFKGEMWDEFNIALRGEGKGGAAVPQKAPEPPQAPPVQTARHQEIRAGRDAYSAEGDINFGAPVR
jgi:uncharacterized caspase-like protein